MSYSFPPLKIYLSLLFLLFLIFFLVWLPWAEVNIVVEQEPLSLDFDITVRPDFQQVLPELSIIPSYYVDFQDLADKSSSYFLIEELRETEKEKILTFRKEDVEKIIDFESKLILDEFVSQKQIQSEKMVKEIFWPSLSEENFEILSLDLNNKRVKLRVSLKGEVGVNYDWSLFTKKIAGQSLSEARVFLKGIKGINKIKIKNWPNFCSRLPLFSSRIKIKAQGLNQR